MNSHAVDGQTILHQLVIIGNISQRCKQWDNNPTIMGFLPFTVQEFLIIHNITNTIPIKKLEKSSLPH
jgi:hypothetical protein